MHVAIAQDEAQDDSFQQSPPAGEFGMFREETGYALQTWHLDAGHLVLPRDAQCLGKILLVNPLRAGISLRSIESFHQDGVTMPDGSHAASCRGAHETLIVRLADDL